MTAGTIIKPICEVLCVIIAIVCAATGHMQVAFFFAILALAFR